MAHSEVKRLLEEDACFDLSAKPCSAYLRSALIKGNTVVKGNTVSRNVSNSTDLNIKLKFVSHMKLGFVCRN